ncbi:hypothetical protein ACHAWF_003100, partial [Thalassiosira exigua]
MDIAFGDCLSVGGTRYALILVDRACRYNWVFRLKSLSSEEIIGALKSFRAEAGRLATLFRCDCDEKLFGSAIWSFLHAGNSCVEAAPSGWQSANGLVESHWKTMVYMSRTYLTEKQMPRKYWFPAIKHSARMMNMIPGKFCGRLASPFMLVHGVRPDQRMWTPIFSVCYFHHEKDWDDKRSHTQAHTMDGIIVGRSPTSNAVLVYNPHTKQYYEPDSYRIDPYRLPSSMYPAITYDGGLFCSLLRDDNPQVEEPYPPGTRGEWRTWIPPRRCSVQGRSWTSPWIPGLLPIISSCSTMVPPDRSRLRTWRLSSRSHLSLRRRTRPQLLCPRSSATTPALPTSTTASITRVSSAGLATATVSAVGLTSTRSRRIGACLSQTFTTIGASSVSRASLCQVTGPIRLFNPCPGL